MSLEGSLKITHIGTATAIIDIDGVTFLTDPTFNGPSEYDVGITVLKSSEGPAIPLEKLPHIDLILLSHEDHPDNLDESGRTLLNGRKVITTIDGYEKLQPRPDVKGITPWETVTLKLQNKVFEITGVPCQHFPGGECTGFVIFTESFGYTEQGLKKAIYVTGDTRYFDELKDIKYKMNFQPIVTIMNLGNATAPLEQPYQLTMGGNDAAKLFKDLQAEILVPLHFESWNHFMEGGKDLAKALEAQGLKDEIAWLTPGETKKLF